MADYYSVIARAVSLLPNNDAQSRQRAYERAETALVAAMRAQNASAPDLMRGQAALEAAIQRVEAELRIDPIHISKLASPAPRPATRSGVAQDSHDIRDRRQLPKENKPIAQATSLPSERSSERSDQPTKPPIDPGGSTDDLGGMLQSLGVMYIGVALTAAVLALLGTVYFYSLILAYAHNVSYLIPFVGMSAALCLFAFLASAIFHKMHFAIDFLLARAHLASRRRFISSAQTKL